MDNPAKKTNTPPIESLRKTGLISYAPMLEEQRARQRAIAKGTAPNTLYLLEHAPVITLGRNSHEENLRVPRALLKQRGIEVAETDRGGDVTYHGPGQLVAYPLLDLNQWCKSVNWYLRTLEDVLLDVLDTYGLEGGRVEGLTGVWVNGAKVAAIGVGLRRWVTCHGIAFNVNPDMSHFACIIPCGIADKPVTSLSQLLGAPPPMAEVMDRFEGCFKKRFESPSSVT